MSNHTTLKTLFATLRGTLPYEYDGLYTTNNNTGPNIVITKKDSERTIYIAQNTPDDNGIIDTTLCDGEPVETLQWDTNDPNLNLIDLITYLEKSL